MLRILILFAHPRTDRSEVNIRLATTAQKLEFVTLVDLYAEYPTLEINIPREQKRLQQHDIIIFQHPLYWYSTPAILKEWQDLVLEYGFAYGARGRALEGKTFLSAITCGAPRETYTKDGAYEHELRDLMTPFEKTAKLCHMRYLPPFALCSAGTAKDQGRIDQHIINYQRLLLALTAEQLDLDKAETSGTLSDDLDRLIIPSVPPASSSRKETV